MEILALKMSGSFPPWVSSLYHITSVYQAVFLWRELNACAGHG